jgi:hypothetical protein
LPDRQSGFTRKGLHLCGLWAFVSLPATAALKGSKNAWRTAARIGKESFSRWPQCAKEQLAIATSNCLCAIASFPRLNTATCNWDMRLQAGVPVPHKEIDVKNEIAQARALAVHENLQTPHKF